MAQTARVNSFDALRDFKVSLLKFAHSSHVAMDEADSDMQRTLNWLENEQISFWTGAIRRCQEQVQRCKEAVRMKTAFKNSTGGRDSVVEEEKALNNALRKLQEAEMKLKATKQWCRTLQKEILLYKGHVQRFNTAIASDVPTAAAHLERMLKALKAYVELKAPAGAAEPEKEVAKAGFTFGEVFGEMAREEAAEVTKPEQPSTDQTDANPPGENPQSEISNPKQE